MLSFVSGEKIAELFKDKKKIMNIFIKDDDDKNPDIIIDIPDLIQLIDESDYIKLKRINRKIKPIEMTFLMNNITKYKSFNDNFKKIFEQLVEISRDKLKFELMFDEKDIHLTPFLNLNILCNWFIVGISGSGKTWFAKELVKNVKLEIFYISPKDDDEPEDKSLIDLKDKDNFNHIIINEVEDINKLPSIKELENNIIIFDDLDTLKNTKSNNYLKEHMLNVRDRILTRGRHYNVKSIVLSHKLRNYKETIVPREECAIHVMFPRSNKFKYDGYLKEYYKFPIKLRKEILKSAKKSRWVLIKNKYPSYIMTQNLIKLL